MKKRDVILTTQSHSAAWEGFHAALEAASRREGWRSSDTLRRFLEAGYYALRGRLLLDERFEKNEAEYMKIVQSCQSPKETMADLATMFAETLKALTTEPVDFLGPIFSELKASAELGQFFTPHHLSVLMAKVTLGDGSEAKKIVEKNGFITLSEPAVGCGGMVLAANTVLREVGIDLATQAHWSVIDVDPWAIYATYIQLSLTDCSADVYRGSALSDPSELVGIRTPAAVMFPKRRRVDAPSGDIPPPAAPPAGTQLSFF